MARAPTNFRKYVPKQQPVASPGYDRAKIIGKNRQTSNSALAGVQSRTRGVVDSLEGSIRANQTGIRANEAGGQAASAATGAAIESSNQLMRAARQVDAGVQQTAQAGIEAREKYMRAEFQADEIRFENFMLKERALMERSLTNAKAKFRKTEEYENQVRRIEQESNARVDRYIANNVNGAFSDQFAAAGKNELGTIAYRAQLEAPELNRQKAEVDMLAAFEDRMAAGDWQEAWGKLLNQAPTVIRDEARLNQVMQRAETQVAKRALERVGNEAEDLIENPNIDYKEAHEIARDRVSQTFEALRQTFPGVEAFSPEEEDRFFRSVEGNGAYNIVQGFQSSIKSGAVNALSTLNTILDSDNPYRTLKETLDFPGNMTRAQSIQALESLKGTRAAVQEKQRENALGIVEAVQDGTMELPEIVKLSQLDSVNGFGGLPQTFREFFLQELPNIRDAAVEDMEADQFRQLEEYEELEADLLELSVVNDKGKWNMGEADAVEEDFLRVMQGAPDSVKKDATLLYLGTMSRNLDRSIMVSAGFGSNAPIPNEVRGLMEDYLQNAKLTVRRFGASTNALSKIRADLQMIARSSITADGQAIQTPSGETRRIEDDLFKIRQQDAAAAAKNFSSYLMTMWVKGQMSARSTSQIIELMELRNEGARQEMGYGEVASSEPADTASALEEATTETPEGQGNGGNEPSQLSEDWKNHFRKDRNNESNEPSSGRSQLADDWLRHYGAGE